MNLQTLLRRSVINKILFITLSGAVVFSIASVIVYFIIFSNEQTYHLVEQLIAYAKAHPFNFSLLLGFLTFQATLIPIVMTYFLIKTEIINPLNEIADRMEKISVGELEEEMIIDREDEIGNLQESFERMRVSLKVIIDKLESEQL
ncbi:HAMP domain-containing protein [Persephonella sp.]